jgi:tetratricopeptide (TPR) repeat protein
MAMADATLSQWLGILLVLGSLPGVSPPGWAEGATNSPPSGGGVKILADMPTALKTYAQAERANWHNATELCRLARKYFELTYLTSAPAVQKEVAARALECSLRAASLDANNATAQACVAVSYAKSCEFADIRTKLEYSRNFKRAAEAAIALDPRQDVAYFLLGRWHYGVANVGTLSRAYVKLVYGGLPQASNAEAIANMRKAIALAPDRIIYHAGLAMVYRTTGERQLELAELEKCRTLKPASLEDEEARRDAMKQLAARGR